MAFEWLSFLDSHRVPYVTSGPNVSRGNIAVRCPFCGTQDPSQHMSINLQGKGWHCFRNREHVGKSPVGLVQALLRTTQERAMQIVGESVFIPEDFMGAVLARLDPQPPTIPKTKLKMPAEFKPIALKPSAKHFIAYLEGPSRQFTRSQIMRMTENYDMYYATQGPMRGRVVFLVKYEGKLVTWTGRTIYASEELRYRTLSADPEIEEQPARGPINDYLLWHDDLIANADDCDTLILCEGPFDALKVSVLGARHGITATCFFTASPSLRQIDLLHDVSSQYRRRCLLLDRGTLSTAMRAQSALSTLQMRVLSLPSNVKDPGLLDEISLRKIIVDG